MLEDFKKIIWNPGKNKIPWDSRGPLLYIHMTPIIEEYTNKICKDPKKVLVKRSDVMQSIKEHPGFVADGVVKKIDGRTYRCVVFVKKLAPRAITEILNG